MHLWYEWDFNAAEKEWEKFFELNPSGFAAGNYSDFLYATGRFKKAFDLALKRRDVDKNNGGNWIDLAFGYYYLNQPGEAMAMLDSAWLRFNDARLFWFKAWLFIYLGKHQQAINNINKYYQSFPEEEDLNPRAQSWLAISHFYTDHRDKTETILDSLKIRSAKSPVGSPAFHIGMIYSATGRKELALQWLQKAYANHEVEMYWLKVEPLFKSLHNDPGYKELLKKIGFN
jgi:tetratricopeptide (TPR) repeat protein